MAEEPLSYEEKLAIAEQAFQVMQHPEFKEQTTSFLDGLASVWPGFSKNVEFVHAEVLRLVQNMIQFGIVSERKVPIERLRLTPEDLVRYQAEAIAYRKESNRRMIEDSVPYVQGGEDAPTS